MMDTLKHPVEEKYLLNAICNLYYLLPKELQKQLVSVDIIFRKGSSYIYIYIYIYIMLLYSFVLLTRRLVKF